MKTEAPVDHVAVHGAETEGDRDRAALWLTVWVRKKPFLFIYVFTNL